MKGLLTLLIFLLLPTMYGQEDSVYFGGEVVTLKEFNTSFTESYKILTPVRGGLIITQEQALQLNSQRKEDEDVQVEFGAVVLLLFSHSKLQD